MPRLYNNIVSNLHQREIASNSRQSSDQIVKSFFKLTDSFYRTDLKIHKACVNAIKFSSDGQWLCSGGDDLAVKISNVEKSLSKKDYRPLTCKLKHESNIFCLAFNHDASRVFSGGTDQLIIHDTLNGDLINSKFLDFSSICDLDISPQNENVIAVGGENGRIYTFDCRSNSAVLIDELLPWRSHTLQSIQYNPMQSHLLLVALGGNKDVSLLDLRKLKTVFSYYSPMSDFAMSARYNSLGNQLLVLRRRLSSSLYNSNSSYSICEFDNFGFYSTITNKNPCFAGPNDEFACIPSDDFSVYLFEIPDELKNRSSECDHPIKFMNSATYILKGHQSIVNQVEYNYKRSIIATSGVESVIKYWSPFPLRMNDEAKEDDFSSSNSNDRNISDRRSLSISDLLLDEDSNSERYLAATNEDTVVLSFFDNLLKRDFCDDDSVDFDNFLRRNAVEKLKDHQFEVVLRYVRSLILDFKANNDRYKIETVKYIEREQAQDAERSKTLCTPSISYLFTHKKIKQSKTLLKRYYLIILKKLHFIRNLKKEKFNNQSDEWYSNAQTLIDGEPELRQMLIDLCVMYKDKRALESLSSPLYCQLVERLTKIYSRRSHIHISSSDDDSNLSNDTIADLLLDLHSSDATSDSNYTSEQDERSADSETDHSHTDSNSSSSDTSLKYVFSMSEDSLSAGTVLNDETNCDETSCEKESINNLKRKNFNLKHIRLTESTDESEDSCDARRQFKRSRDESEQYNKFAFDSEVDASTSTDSNASDKDSMMASTSTSRKRPLVKLNAKIDENFEKRETKINKNDQSSDQIDFMSSESDDDL